MFWFFEKPVVTNVRKIDIFLEVFAYFTQFEAHNGWFSGQSKKGLILESERLQTMEKIGKSIAMVHPKIEEAALFSY